MEGLELLELLMRCRVKGGVLAVFVSGYLLSLAYMYYMIDLRPFRKK